MQVVKCIQCQKSLVNVDRNGNVLPITREPYAQVDNELKYIKKTKPEPLFHLNDRVKEPCLDCGGSGNVDEDTACPACSGAGTISVGTPFLCPGCGTINRIM